MHAEDMCRCGRIGLHYAPTLVRDRTVDDPWVIRNRLVIRAETVSFVARLIEWKRPTLTLGYLTAFDHEQHEAGPWTPQAFAVLERVDAALDTIVQAARRTYGNQVTIAVAS